MKTIIFILALLFAFTANAGAYKENRKHQKREFQYRAESCRKEQLRIQTSGQTHYKKRNAWQPKQKKAIRTKLLFKL